MRFVVDENLPPALAAWLNQRGEEAAHVYDVALDHTLDTRIREAAKQSGWVIITKDEDFVREQGPRDGPVLHLTCGNLHRPDLIRRFAACWPELRARLERGERVLASDLKVVEGGTELE